VLGLQSRQAAEQRWLRLGGPTDDAPTSPDGLRAPAAARRRRPARPEPGHGVDVDRLRALIVLLHNRLLRSADDGIPAVRLARSTLDVAADAPPGAVHDLAAQAVDDLSHAPEGAVAPPVRELADRVVAAATGRG
jgi:hypothetical protein